MFKSKYTVKGEVAMRSILRSKSWASLPAVGAIIFASPILVSVGPVPAAAYENQWGANYFPNVELTDQYGHKLHFYDDLLKGKIVAIEQFYTHCIDICPLETARLAQVQKMLGDRVGKDIFFYSISIDPKRDSPEAMKEYADTYHADRKSTRLNSSHGYISYAVFCLK